MIAFQAWRCRRAIRRYLQATTRRTFAESMLALFVESGTVYTVLWILKNIIIIPVVEPSAYTDYATVVMYQMTGMYPTVIIILVALKNSHLEHQFTGYGTPRDTVETRVISARFVKSAGASDLLVSSDATQVESRDAEKAVF